MTYKEARLASPLSSTPYITVQSCSPPTDPRSAAPPGRTHSLRTRSGSPAALGALGSRGSGRVCCRSRLLLAPLRGRAALPGTRLGGTAHCRTRSLEGAGWGRGRAGAGAGRARVLTERAGGGAERSGRPTRAAAGAGGAGGAGVAGGGGPGAAGPEGGRAGGGAAAPWQCRLPRGGRSGTPSVSAPRPPRRGRAPGAAARQLSGGGGLRGTQRARGRPVRDDCASRPRPPANRSRPDGPAAPRPPGSSSSAAAGSGKVCGASAGRPDPRGLRGASSAGPR